MLRFCAVVLLLLLSAVPMSAQESLLPWEVWRDPGVAARAPEGVRTVVSSSTCPEGSKFDRHSPEESRFIRTEDGEGVIFETEGAGAVTRIWMTQGEGISHDLDPSIRIKIYVDGGIEPVVDLTANALFAGDTEPFLSPMVLDRARSGGGNVSFVPIPFQSGCRVSLSGAEDAKIWYQVTAVLVDEGFPVVSFSKDIDIGPWRKMLQHPGADPWPQRAWPTVSGSVMLTPGNFRRLVDFGGPDQITGIMLRVPRGRWAEMEIRLLFDGRQTAVMPLTWFFAVRGRSCLPTRSLFIGAVDGELYSYFPMPFFERATILVGLSSKSKSSVEFEFAVRRAGRAPAPDAGVFQAGVIDAASSPGTGAELMDLSGRGRLAGVAFTTGLTEGKGWVFLEGDETVVVDGETSWRGTGVEDFFAGGFYFRDDNKTPQPFRRALHGFTCLRGSKKLPTMSLYRLLPTDGPFFARSLQFWEEGGPIGDHPVRWRGVYWSYVRPEPE